MDAATFLTIAKPGEGIVREKMSKFIAFARHASDAAEAKEIVKNIQNEYHDARHVCWAYMIGPERTEWQLNDNGEPSGTAGKPILGQINSRGLTDVVVAVVRYFGGIKLGTPGLIAAYREAAALALDDAGSKVMADMEPLEINFPYIQMEKVMKVLKNEAEFVEVTERNFDNTCLFKLMVRKDVTDRLKKSMSEIEGLW